MRPWVLAETNYTHTKNHQYEVAVLAIRCDGAAQSASPVLHGRV